MQARQIKIFILSSPVDIFKNQTRVYQAQPTIHLDFDRLQSSFASVLQQANKPEFINAQYYYNNMQKLIVSLTICGQIVFALRSDQREVPSSTYADRFSDPYGESDGSGDE